LVSAALTDGVPRKIVLPWHEGAFELVVSHELLYELQIVLSRRKFRRYRPEKDTLDYVLWIRENATLALEGNVLAISRDPDDDYLLALATNSGADCLVLGEGGLLGLEGTGMQIIPPRGFREILESTDEER
jgi:putative PIN family toxin of toxin-antitoxin system